MIYNWNSINWRFLITKFKGDGGRRAAGIDPILRVNDARNDWLVLVRRFGRDWTSAPEVPECLAARRCRLCWKCVHLPRIKASLEGDFQNGEWKILRLTSLFSYRASNTQTRSTRIPTNGFWQTSTAQHCGYVIVFGWHQPLSSIRFISSMDILALSLTIDIGAYRFRDDSDPSNFGLSWDRTVFLGFRNIFDIIVDLLRNSRSSCWKTSALRCAMTWSLVWYASD